MTPELSSDMTHKNKTPKPVVC